LQVQILEKEDKVAELGSGNRQGALYSKLSVDVDLFAQFNLHALLYAHRVYAEYRRQSGDSDGASGILHLAYDEREAALQRRLSEQFDDCADFIRFVDKQEASELAGVEIPFPGYFIPDGGWLSPPGLCSWLIDHPNITLRTSAEVSQLLHDGGVWKAFDDEGALLASAEAAVIANAADAARFEQSAFLPLKSIRGQVSLLDGAQCLNELRTVVTAAGYITPAWHDKQCFGATFDHRDHTPSLRQQDHQTNLDKLLQAIPQAGPHFDAIDIAGLQGRTGFRCATPDYLPAVGFVPNGDRFRKDYQRLAKDANADIPFAGEYYPNLLVSVGLGSRGIAYTPLCGELIAALLTGSPLPVSRSLAAALNPARFLIRDIIRGKFTR
jgi:tRNA 5-methylaminomethyl-2-thiouridine biosynthesis bifunctional protein